MNIKKVSIDKMYPAKYNPRKDLKPKDKKYQHIKNSIESFGYLDPIIWNERNGVIVGGHQRFKILKELGHTEIECVVVDFDDATEKAANLSLNKASGDWDKETLEALLRDMKFTTNIDLANFGFRMDKFKKEVEEDDYNINLPAEPRTKLGDVWILGTHRLLCGDGTSNADVDKLMEGEQADCLITDPPYNVNYGEKANMLNTYSKGHRITDSIINDNMSDSNFYKFLTALYTQYERALKPGGAAYIFHSENERVNFTKAFEECGFYFSENLIWVKNQLVLTRLDYHYQHEPIIYGWKLGAGHYFCDDRTQSTILREGVDIDKMKTADLRDYIKQLLASFEPTTLEENKPSKNDLHPTMKPIRLCARLLTNSTRANETVIDFCAGSGSTLMAAEQTGRRARVIELHPQYCDVIVDRWEAYTGQQAVLIREKKPTKAKKEKREEN